MKKLLIGLLALGTISTFAGELVSKKSFEKLQFDLNKETNSLTITSTTPLVETQNIKLNSIKRKKSSIDLFAGVNAITDSGVAQGIYPFVAIYDVALLPFKGLAKGLKNSQVRKDYMLLMEAINSDVEVSVPHNRFERIAKILTIPYADR